MVGYIYYEKHKVCARLPYKLSFKIRKLENLEEVGRVYVVLVEGQK